jgi:dipeptidyl aminopeptidase/acylaminoacyl peptidase
VTFRWGRIHAARFLHDGRVVLSAAFEGRPEEVFVRPSGSPTAQGLGLNDVHLLAASATGELAVLIHSKRPFGLNPRGTLARVPSVGGLPRELTDDAEFADWSPGGELAVVRAIGGERILEFPPGHSLFRTVGAISHPRFSPKGDRIAFLHHPIPDDTIGEVVITDLQGQTRTLSKRLPTALGLAWSSDGTEVWFTGGTIRQNTLAAVSLDGRTREIYRSLSDLELQDIAQDGRVLLAGLLSRLEVVVSRDPGGTESVLSWTDWNDPVASLSADGKVLFSTSQTVLSPEGQQALWVVLRATDGAPAQVLGEGFALDLSPDGRWALALLCPSRCTTLTALPTGVGQPRAIPTHGLEIEIRAARWTIDGKAVLAIAREPGQGRAHLYRLAEDGSRPARISDAALNRIGYLQISPDGRWVAALDDQLRVVVISLQDGTVHLLPRTSNDPVPRGWSSHGDLWITQAPPNLHARTRLLRVDPRSGNVLEERSVGPADPGGTTPLQDVVLSRDGQTVAFTYERRLGTLFILRGLSR